MPQTAPQSTMKGGGAAGVRTNIQRHRTDGRIDAKARSNGKLETYLIERSNCSTYLVPRSACSSDTLTPTSATLIVAEAMDSRSQDRANNDDNGPGQVKCDDMSRIGGAAASGRRRTSCCSSWHEFDAILVARVARNAKVAVSWQG